MGAVARSGLKRVFIGNTAERLLNQLRCDVLVVKPAEFKARVLPRRKGMHFVGLAEMAAAVSNAGGLGIITGLTQRTPERLAAEIERCRRMTDQPFGVNLTFLPAVTPPDYPAFVDAIVASGVKVVRTTCDMSFEASPVGAL